MSTNDPMPNHDDPRLTAYVLGELSPSEREQVETLLRDDETARRAVEEIRATTELLTTELQREPVATTLTDAQRAAIGGSSASRPRVRSRRVTRWAIASLATAAVLALSASIYLPSLNRAREVGRAREVDDYAVAANPDAQAKKTEKLEWQRVFPSASPPAPQRQAQTSPSLEMAATPSAASPVEPSQVQQGYAKSLGPAAGSAAFKFENRASTGDVAAAQGPEQGAGGGGKAAPIDSNSGLLLPDDTRGRDSTSGVRNPSGRSNTEAYDRIADNPFLAVTEHALSTFSIDVDTASYSNVRRFIDQMSQLPPKDAVRIEELINYFPYSYPQPTGEAPFGASIEVAGCPWNTQHRLVRIALKGREIAKEKRPASNLVFLIDVSGSMQPANKLPLLKSAMQRLVRELDERDRVAIAVYAGSSGLVLPSTTCDSSGQQKILAALENLSAGGSTNGAEGIQLAYQLAQQSFVKDGTNRVILCTDGDFNVGVTNQGDLTRLIEDKAKGNVFLSVLGFGMGNTKDSTMEKLADKGNGNYAYIDTPSEANKVLVEQMSGTLITIAKDVKIQVEFNPAKVGAYRLIGYENRMLAKEDFNNDKKDAGEIGAGHAVTALYEVVPPGVAVETGAAVDPLKYQPSSPEDVKLAIARERLHVKQDVLRRQAESKGAFSDAEMEAAKRDVETAQEAVKAVEAEVARTKPQPATTDELLTVKLRYKAPDAPADEQGTSKLLEFPVKDDGQSYAKASPDFKFAGAVAAYGMILRDSPHKGSASLDAVVELAQEARGEDRNGYRREFIELVKKTKTLTR